MMTRFNQVLAVIVATVAAATTSATDTTLYFVQEQPFDNDSLMRYDLGTSTLTEVGRIGFGDVRGLAYNATTDTLYGVSRDGVGSGPRLLVIDPDTGAGTLASGNNYLPNQSNSNEISFDAAGNLFGLGRVGDTTAIDTLLSVNTTTGVASAINPGSLSSLTSPAGLAFNHADGTLYSSGFFGSLATIDPVTGTPSAPSTITGANNVARIVFDQDTGVLYGITGFDTKLVTIDPNTNTATVIDDFSQFNQFYAIAAIPIPEPTSLALVLLGGITLGRRRR